MTNQPQDPDLRAHFQALREAEARRAPDFRELIAAARAKEGQSGIGPVGPEPRRTWTPRRWAWGGSLLAAAAATVLILVPGRGTSDAEFITAVSAYSADPAAGAWRSPTDALLEVPGSDVLRSLPKLGGPPWPATSGTNSRSNQL